METIRWQTSPAFKCTFGLHCESNRSTQSSKHINRSKLRVNTCIQHQAGKRVRVTIAFGLTSYWIKRWREIFLSQSLSVVMRKPRKCESNYFRHPSVNCHIKINQKVNSFKATSENIIKQCWFGSNKLSYDHQILGSIVVSIPACHAGDRGSIPRRGETFSFVILSCFSSIKADDTKRQLIIKKILNDETIWNLVILMLNTVLTCCDSMFSLLDPISPYVFYRQILEPLNSQ